MQAMSYDSIIETILNSDPKADWEKSSHANDEHFNCRFYKPDVNLRLEAELDNDGCVTSRPFREDWTDKFPNKNASCYGFGFYYASTLIKTASLVYVDGKILMPMPKAGGTTIVSELDYKAAQMHETLGLLEEYMKRTNFTVSPE